MALQRFLENSERDYGVVRQTTPAGGISILLLYRFVREILAYRPDLVHVRGLGNEGFHAVLAARLAGVRLVLVSVHGTQRDVVSSHGRIRRWVVVHVLERMTLMMATHIATVCRSAARRAFLLPYERKIVGVVPNGVPISPREGCQLRQSVRRELGIPESRLLAVCVSRISPEKGYGVLAEALERLSSHAVDLEFVIVGGGADQELVGRFNRTGAPRVRFVGHQDSVARYYCAADVFVMPSLHENLSNALLEAMSFGLPVIATAVGGTVEVLAQGGGVLVPANDAGALARAIEAVAADADARARMGCQARENAEANYSVAAMVAGWERLYSLMLGARP
ncbi:MAG: glycosyltransferase [Polynucleobacter sp.]|nr:glycosyltransferase [Polynucleobacter sp.]